jgi:hypothetical protein
MVLTHDLSEVPIKAFYNISGDPKISEYVYLVNKPIVKMEVNKSEQNLVEIGNRIIIQYLNIVSYNIGYYISVAGYCLCKPNILFIGTNSLNIKNIGPVDILYYDNYLTILQNKTYSSYLILETSHEDIPQPRI